LQRVLTRELSYGILSPGSRDPHLPSHATACLISRFELAWEDPAESHHLPLTWVRAAILLRINSLIKGHSGIRPVIFERLHALLTHNIIPMVPTRGSISASGDLSPLAYISGTIQGKRTIRVLSPDKKQDVYADEALAEAGLAPVSLTAKEGLAVVNGTAISTAAASLVLHDIHQLVLLSQILTAMSVEALLGSPESFDELFGRVRPHPGQIESARNINAFLRGSQLARIKDGKDGTLRQDRYSIRTAAQWIGPVLEDLLLAHQQITIECNSVTDNPLINDDGKVVHGGNFQAKAVTSAMEKCRQGIQSIGRMVFTQCQELINPATSWGLPPNLVAEEPSKSGIFKAIDIYISALTSELGFLAAPVNHVYTAEMGNQSLNSLALISARYTATAAKILTELAAAHILSLCQALDLRAMHLLFLDSVHDKFNMLVSTLETNLNLQAKEPPLSTILWAHVQKSLEQTVAIDTEVRFVQVAKSIRVPIIDHLAVPLEHLALEEMESLIMKLTVLLQEAWDSNLDVYLDHGDASSILGTASKSIYEYVRKSLCIPFLCTSRIMTPVSDVIDSTGSKEAPTVGGYTSILYRAIRCGELVPIMSEIVRECLASKELCQ
jgi:phenylalanine ammonia-lyase